MLCDENGLKAQKDINKIVTILESQQMVKGPILIDSKLFHYKTLDECVNTIKNLII